ncbi:MAG: hypothetical protein QOE31_362, partial [Solirubrobacteraceae bacterium]|nr:hypothetical protein [Solirubrobacteraceae bacterium]
VTAAATARSAARRQRSLRAAVIGPGARRALREGARGAVELAFGPGGYLRLGEQRVLLAPARSPLGPLSIIVAGLARGDLVPGDTAEVAGDALVAGPLLIDVSRARYAPPPVSHAGPLPASWRAALEAALDGVAPVPAELAPGLGALAAGDLVAGVTALAGRGDGLTPAGDDALAGFAAWRWALGAPVTLPAQRCAPLGRDYVRCAERGELPQPAAAVLEAILAGNACSAARRARGLARWGASSGAALLWGLAAGAAQTSRSRSARAG